MTPPAATGEGPRPHDDADTAASFLREPPITPEVQRLYDGDIAGDGYVMNLSRIWAHDPAASTGLFDLVAHVARTGRLTQRQRAVLVSACAAARRDSYCALAWGKRLADEAGDQAAAAVLSSDYGKLDTAEQALAHWAVAVVEDPSGTNAEDVQVLRDVGFDDTQIFAITAFVALRLAFSTVNDALGSQPDHELWDAAPQAVRAAVTYGRPVQGASP